MHDLIELVKEFPFGSLLVILTSIWAAEESIKAIATRNTPRACCDEDCSCNDKEIDEE